MVIGYEVTYERFKNMLSEIGYANEVKRGFDGIAELLENGVILDSNGNRVKGRRQKGERNRSKSIESKLAGGEPLYIYKPGELYPYKVTYDKEKGFQVSQTPLTKPQRPEKKPGLFARSFFLFFSMTGIMTKSYREWDTYKKQLKLYNDLSSGKVMNERRRKDPILRKKGDAVIKNDPKELVQGLEGVLENELGYGTELEKDGRSAILSLMNQDLVYNEEGFPIHGLDGTASARENLALTLGNELKYGRHLYIYEKDTKGKAEPREIYFDKRKGKLVVTELKMLPAEEKNAAQAVSQKEEQPAASNDQPEQEHAEVMKDVPVQKPKVELILEKLQKAHGDQPLPAQTVKNVEQICANAKLGMEALNNKLEYAQGQKNGMVQGGDDVRFILLQNNLEKQVESGKLDPTYMQLLNAENGVTLLRKAADATPVVHQKTTRASDPSSFKPFVEGGPELDKLSGEITTVLTAMTEDAKAKGTTVDALIKGVAPAKAAKLKDKAEKEIKKEEAKKEPLKKDAPKQVKAVGAFGLG